MTFCIGIAIAHDGPVPELQLADGSYIEATPQRINEAVAAYVKRCITRGSAPNRYEPTWTVARRSGKAHAAVLFGDGYVTTLCSLLLRSDATQLRLPQFAVRGVVEGKEQLLPEPPRCRNCERIAAARKIAVHR